jgi:predicted dithiol-disulfide oxidoreductase (DUF899 family)
MAKPNVVTAEEWQKARDDLLVAEKEATRTLDALAARRRRLPMVRFDNDYTFNTPDGPGSLLDLFEGRQELVLYQFMNNGPDHYCPGWTWFTNNVPPNAPELLADQGITYATVSDMPLEQLEKYRERMSWTLPLASSRGTTFSRDTGAGRGFMLNVFLRDGDEVYRTYSTTGRGTERHVFVTGILDLTVYGRREEWEDSPPGWPQSPTHMFPTTMELHNISMGFGKFK